MIEELDVRLTALADPTDDSSWAEVLSRADELRGRRRPRLAAAIAAVLALTVVATPAVGVRGKIVHLFAKGEPAPRRIEKSFAALGGAAPPLGPGVEAGRAAKVMETPVGAGVKAVLWVAPTTRGGFCSALELEGLGGAGAECLQLHEDGLSVDVSLHGRASTEGAALSGPVLIDGFTGMERADSLVLRFQDGDSQRIPLVWVSAPVNTGFFVYGLPERHWRAGHLPTTLTLLAADGDQLDERDIHGIPTRERLRCYAKPALRAATSCSWIQER